MGCKHEVPSAKPEDNITTLLVGNAGSYWVYEWFSYDTNGTRSKLFWLDTITVIGDTVLNGMHFQHIHGTFGGEPIDKFLRDSSTCIVNYTGQISYCGNKTFGTSYKDYDQSGYIKRAFTLNSDKNKVSVPAGAFDCVSRSEHFMNSDGSWFTACDSILVLNNFYALGVGEVLRQYGNLNLLRKKCTYYEMQLSDYKIITN